jgi:hypothetical protein
VGIDFKPLAIVGDAQPVGDVLVETTVRRCFRVGQFSPPLDRHHLPAHCRSLPDDFGAKRLCDYIADPFKIRHGQASKQDASGWIASNFETNFAAIFAQSKAFVRRELVQAAVSSRTRTLANSATMCSISDIGAVM